MEFNNSPILYKNIEKRQLATMNIPLCNGDNIFNIGYTHLSVSYAM